jgi:hypothetical protein
VHIVPGVHVPPQPSLGALPHARVEGAVHVGVQHEPLLHRSPDGHIVPGAHAGQPAGTLGVVPHVRAEGFGHAGQQLVPMQLDPVVHIVPVPHMRHTRPIEST